MMVGMGPTSAASACRSALLVFLGALAGGCAHWPATPRLEQAGGPGYRGGGSARPRHSPARLEQAGPPGYRVDGPARPGQSDDVLLFLAMSGGGTRAAALGY